MIARLMEYPTEPVMPKSIKATYVLAGVLTAWCLYRIGLAVLRSSMSELTECLFPVVVAVGAWLLATISALIWRICWALEHGKSVEASRSEWLKRSSLTDHERDNRP